MFDDCHESRDDLCNIIPSFTNKPDEIISFKNVISGAFSVLTRRNKTSETTDNQLQCPRSDHSDVSFLEFGKNGDVVIDSSVYMPSAPFFDPVGINYGVYKDLLEAEPPVWLPDSSATACMWCSALFTALSCGRHHCRFCGGVFCRGCTKRRCLLPVKFRERNPQRVCDACYEKLDPVQGFLINTVSNAVQVAKHDVMDWTCSRGWLNLPIGLSMEHEIFKSSNTLRSYCK
ncbi:zinc ion binding protein, partial [Trifolium pratense]